MQQEISRLHLPEDFSPESTHRLYLDSPVIPQLAPEEHFARIRQLHELGYVSIAGVYVYSWRTSVKNALNLHEQATLHLRNGALVGPFCISYGVRLPGIMFYKPPI